MPKFFQKLRQNYFPVKYILKEVPRTTSLQSEKGKNAPFHLNTSDRVGNLRNHIAIKSLVIVRLFMFVYTYLTNCTQFYNCS